MARRYMNLPGPGRGHIQRPLVIAACAPNMQNKMFRDAFAAEGMDVKKDMFRSTSAT